MNAIDILNHAADHMRDRAKTYDKPEGERSMAATVSAFNAVTGHNLTETQGWLIMAILKMVRSQQGAHKADNFEDLTAYSALAGESSARAQTSVPVSDCGQPDDGWIEWGGGECPVGNGVKVDIRFREGSEFLRFDADREWNHKDHPFDIIAYRVVKP